SKTSLWPRKVRSVPSSSSFIRRLYSATSAERIVASLRSSGCEVELSGSPGTGHSGHEIARHHITGEEHAALREAQGKRKRALELRCLRQAESVCGLAKSGSRQSTG